MEFGKPPYYSGKTIAKSLVLDRYLPVYPTGSIVDMLHFIGINNGWVLDPIGNQPMSAIELAQAGFSVLVTDRKSVV